MLYEVITAHDRHGDGLDDRRELADEGQHDGDHGRAADDPDRVDAGDGHDADVLAVGGGGHGEKNILPDSPRQCEPLSVKPSPTIWIARNEAQRNNLFLSDFRNRNNFV